MYCKISNTQLVPENINVRRGPGSPLPLPHWIHKGWARQSRLHSGVYISVQKRYLSPPPHSENDIFPPLATCRFSTTIVAFLPYIFPILHLFHLFLPFYSFLLLPFPSPFFLFLLHFPSFSLPLFIFFSPKWHRLIFSSQGGGFQYIDPCLHCLQNLASKADFFLTHSEVACGVRNFVDFYSNRWASSFSPFCPFANG